MEIGPKSLSKNHLGENVTDMNDVRTAVVKAKTAKEKCEILQKVLGGLKEESIEGYAILLEAFEGGFGAPIRGYAKKCVVFANKKFPGLRAKADLVRQEELDKLINSAADYPDSRICPICQLEIPFSAIKCHHCSEFTKIEPIQTVENTYTKSAVDIMKKAFHLGASDIHLSVGYRPIFRISGTMEHQKDLPVLKPSDTLSLGYQLLNEDSKRLYQSNKEVDQAYEVPNTCRLRLNIAQERLGSAVVARILPSEILSMEDLRFRNQDVFSNLCMEVNGLILVTGPTGSGKSTTLAAMLDYINTNRSEHMITIEDPIEFVHSPKKSKIMQRELRTNTLSFGNALKSALRQDPDIILVGELRDIETTSLALEAAETGHLVFGTLHTNSASKTIDRIVNMFPAEDQAKIRMNLSENLKGIIAQQLIKKEGGGRIAIQEIMLKSTAISALIRDAKTFQINEYIQTAKDRGMQLMDDMIKAALSVGDISPENAYRYALNKVDFAYTKKQQDDI
jgi:twitching motility protein PilT